LYKILVDFGIPMKPVRLIKMCLNETNNRVRVGKHACMSDMFHTSDMFPINSGSKQLSPLLFNVSLKYATRIVHANRWT
jgi:hypothetical protein